MVRRVCQRRGSRSGNGGHPEGPYFENSETIGKYKNFSVAALFAFH